MSRVAYITLCFICLLTIDSPGQANLRFEHLTISQGLSNQIVYDMLQDRQGYLWFATDNGLNRFDGYTITTYQKIPGNTTSLSGNSLPHLLEDSEGSLWIGMMGQGICRFDPHTETFTCYPNPPNSRQGAIHTMSEDRQGNLWLSTGQADLWKFDKRTGRYNRDY